MSRTSLACLLLVLCAATVRAAPPAFSLPVQCNPGKDCWVVNYSDHDRSGTFHDYRCGWRGYDGHDGTDIALAGDSAMRAGVPVLAAADGVVAGVRNTMPDRRLRTKADRAAVKNVECGNGVLLKHPDGWETQYCHLKRGSVTVRKGQTVKRGDALGKVGLSGMTEFPHVHFAVRHQGKKTDPFTGTVLGTVADGASCQTGTVSGTLWQPTALAQQPYPDSAIIIRSGITSGKPDWAAVEPSSSLPADAAALVVWFESYAMPEGSTVTIRLLDPDGREVRRSTLPPTSRKMLFRAFAGKLRGKTLWQTGEWTGKIAVTHADGKVVEQSATVRIHSGKPYP